MINSSTSEVRERVCAHCHCTITEGMPYALEESVDCRAMLVLCNGCHETFLVNNYLQTGTITLKLLHFARCASDYYGSTTDSRAFRRTPQVSALEYQAIWSSAANVNRCMREFERLRWLDGGLQEFVCESDPHQRLAGELEHVRVRLVQMAGQCIIKLEDVRSAQFVTLVTPCTGGLWQWTRTQDQIMTRVQLLAEDQINVLQHNLTTSEVDILPFAELCARLEICLDGGTHNALRQLEQFGFSAIGRMQIHSARATELTIVAVIYAAIANWPDMLDHESSDGFNGMCLF